ncbi:MAG: serine/threonine protein kinase [Conexibacter sp.]|nr:serine/threonine protein kinase [Conexibacter sp.]
MTDDSERPYAAVPDLKPGAEFAGYRIERLLDRGGMGVVYMATEIELDRTVALKLIAPEHARDETAVARFKSEARLAASLEHPNIVPIHRGGEQDGVIFLAMRFVSGTNLRRVIDRGPMALPRIGRIITEIAAALDVAHTRGLVHRDVKPANILVSGEGEDEHVYLTDFGLTKRLGTSGGVTRVGGWVGTPDYVAPEQIQAHQVDRRADVYSLGCVLFEMLTGRVAYPKDSDMAKLWAHVADPPPLPRTERPDLVEAFDRVVARATAKDPDDRYDTAGQMAAAVRQAVAAQAAKSETDAAQATSDGEPPPLAPTVAERPNAEPEVAVSAAPARAAPDGPAVRRPRGRRTPLIVLAVAGVAAAVVAVVLLTRSSGTTSSNATRTPAPAGEKVAANLGPVPMNRVAGDGNVDVRLNGAVATVSLSTARLLNAAHPIHIHAGARGICPPAAAARPHNGHLAISTHDGVPYYGPPVTALTTRGRTNTRSILALTRFPNKGAIRYRRQLRLSKAVAEYVRQGGAVIVVHGDDYNHNGIYDNGLDRSDLDRSLPGELTTPALCGPLAPAKASAASPGPHSTARGPGHLYSASLRPPVQLNPALVCPLHQLPEGDRPST